MPKDTKAGCGQNSGAMNPSARSLLFVAVALVAAGCAPALNWRETRPDGSAAVVMFPCRAASHARTVALAGAQRKMFMYACNAGDTTYAFSFADVSDPARVDDSLMALREAAVANIGATVGEAVAFEVRGMSASAQARRVAMSGKLPSGASARMVAAFFARGTTVYQATVVGNEPDAEATEVFLSGIELAQ